MKPVHRLLLAAVLGALAVGGFAPLEWFPLTACALAGLFALWRSRPESAPATAYAWGLGLFLAGVSWIYVSLSRYGGMGVPLSLLAVLLFAAVLAVFPMLAGWLFRRLRRGSWRTDALLAAAAWTLSEWLRTWFLTGFPWLIVGYSQTPPSPLAGFAAVFGVHGVTLALTLVAALPVFAWGDRRRFMRAGAAALALVLCGAGLARIAWTTPRGASVSVSLLQGNIEQSLKWRPELLSLSLDTYLDLARRHPARIVVLPETALPLAFERIPADYLAALRPAGSDLILGTVTFDRDGSAYNAAVSLGAGGTRRYAKSHLVPFGEFTPALFQWTLKLLSIPMSDFSRGGLRQPPFSLAGEKLAADICYEDAFGEEIVQALPEASILLNLSNTAWFGDSLAQPQHLQMSRMRALETGRPMLRATNTGMTAFINPDGVVLAQLPPFVAGGLTVNVHGYDGLTPYARWQDWPAVLLALVFLVAGRFVGRPSGRQFPRMSG
ncbi:MAG: apolipoprotein N-acyltransferase [Rhodocyclaceae bacterium]|nr:apolipoprotein N-acyltransferase [Rhodocyclaceae bacterium]